MRDHSSDAVYMCILYTAYQRISEENVARCMCIEHVYWLFVCLVTLFSRFAIDVLVQFIWICVFCFSLMKWAVMWLFINTLSIRDSLCTLYIRIYGSIALTDRILIVLDFLTFLTFLTFITVIYISYISYTQISKIV